MYPKLTISLILGIILIENKASADDIALWLPFSHPVTINCDYCGYTFPGGKCHGGIDYKSSQPEPILAAQDGIVIKAVNDLGNTKNEPFNPSTAYGNYVKIKHTDGHTTIYAHLKSVGIVEGTTVQIGDTLGASDNSGWSTGPHLHFEVRDANGKKVNPYGDKQNIYQCLVPNISQDCGPNALWATCPPVPYDSSFDDKDKDDYTVAQGDCNDNNPVINPGIQELCDGIDNNCNSQTDENWTKVNQSCSKVQGVCITQGTWVCAQDQQSIICTAPDPFMESEKCDSQDNDCDGLTDEDFKTGLAQDLGNPCTVGLGECQNQGVMVCTKDGKATVCSVDAKPIQQVEVCDGKDNDCDGTADNGQASLTCDQPPSNTCLDDNTLRIYNPAGTCLSGACDYSFTETFCPNGCLNAQCQNCLPDCAGKECGSDGCGGSCGVCDDKNPCISVSACQDGICTGTPDKDTDGDGFIDQNCGGSDCNDTQKDVNPTATDYVENFCVQKGWKDNAIISQLTSTTNGYAMAMDSVNNVHIAYEVVPVGLKYLTNSTGIWQSIELSSTQQSEDPLIAVDSKDKMHVTTSEHYLTNGSGAWETHDLPIVYYGGDLAVDQNDNVLLIATTADYALKFLLNDGTDWQISSVANVAKHCANLSVSNSSDVHAVYITFENSYTKIMHGILTGDTWSSETIKQIHVTTKESINCPDIITDSQGYTHICYTWASPSANMAALRYSTNVSGEWVDEFVFIDAWVNGWCSITIGANNQVYIISDSKNGELPFCYKDKVANKWICEKLFTYLYGTYKSLSLNSQQAIAANPDNSEVVVAYRSLINPQFTWWGDLTYNTWTCLNKGLAGDENCDGVDGTDADGDGFASLASGGDDCDDTNSDIYPTNGCP